MKAPNRRTKYTIPAVSTAAVGFSLILLAAILFAYTEAAATPAVLIVGLVLYVGGSLLHFFKG